MSSNFCISTRCCIALGALLSASCAVATPLRFAEVVALRGSELSAFDGQAIDRLGMLACTPAECHPIPFQVDERDAAGRWVLDQGPMPMTDEPPGVLDANDLLLFMAADAGDRAARGALLIPPPCQGAGKGEVESAGCVNLPRPLVGKEGFIGAEITLRDPLDATTRWAYLVAFAGAAPRAAEGNVAYDPVTDRVRGRRVSLGFADGVPGYLAVHGLTRTSKLSEGSFGAASSDPTGSGLTEPSARGSASLAVGDGANLLDRLKVRASATFLFGLIHFSRSEADLRTEFMGWHAGPIRIVRGQRQWVRLGWGIHSPTFGSYTYFYRDFAELPVSLYLNFKPTYFFGNILVQAILDFRDLTGWSLIVPSLPESIPIDGRMTAQKAALAQLPDTWFAVRGPQITLVESMDVSPSLATVRHRLVYRETTQAEPPEAVPGEAPGIGYQLDQWEHVGAGAHQLESVSYALPLDVDVRAFMHTRGAPLQITVGMRDW